MADKQISALTSTRGFAALLIVIFHFGLERFPFVHMQQFFAKGNMGVSYFFVLSGFIMCLVYNSKHVQFGDYMKRRIARIAPVYILAIILSQIPTIWQHYAGNVAFKQNYFKELLLNGLFLQAYIPGYALSINSPGWSLSVEMFFYLLFPLLILLYQKNPKGFVWLSAIVFAVSQAAHLYFMSKEIGKPFDVNRHELIYYFPLNHLNEFMAGIAGYYFYDRWKHAKWIRQIPSITLIVLMVILVIELPYSLHNGLLAPLYLLFIIVVAVQEPVFLRWKPLVYLGEISYGVYMLQMPMYYYMAKLNFHVIKLTNMDWFFLEYVIGLLLAAAISYHFIENPLRRLINRVGVKKPVKPL
ncbi:MAG TPA: acyltransferase [Flavipsychrobacter sp.]